MNPERVGRFMSDGQQSRLVFAFLAECKPHILFLDEPTNHLDMESIDSLAGTPPHPHTPCERGSVAIFRERKIHTHTHSLTHRGRKDVTD